MNFLKIFFTLLSIFICNVSSKIGSIENDHQAQVLYNKAANILIKSLYDIKTSLAGIHKDIQSVYNYAWIDRYIKNANIAAEEINTLFSNSDFINALTNANTKFSLKNILSQQINEIKYILNSIEKTEFEKKLSTTKLAVDNVATRFLAKEFILDSEKDEVLDDDLANIEQKESNSEITNLYKGKFHRGLKKLGKNIAYYSKKAGKKTKNLLANAFNYVFHKLFNAKRKHYAYNKVKELYKTFLEATINKVCKHEKLDCADLGDRLSENNFNKLNKIVANLEMTKYQSPQYISWYSELVKLLTMFTTNVDF